MQLDLFCDNRRTIRLNDADQRISVNLDDGVMVNYGKFGVLESGDIIPILMSGKLLSGASFYKLTPDFIL